jgi:hypothetical protein
MAVDAPPLINGASGKRPIEIDAGREGYPRTPSMAFANGNNLASRGADPVQYSSSGTAGFTY